MIIVLSIPKVGPLNNQNMDGLMIDNQKTIYQVSTAIDLIKYWWSKEKC